MGQHLNTDGRKKRKIYIDNASGMMYDAAGNDIEGISKGVGYDFSPS